MLVLENKANTIEKRIFQVIIRDLIKNKVTPKTHDIYLLESEGMDTLLRFKKQMKEKLEEFEMVSVNLLAVVDVHGGIGFIAIQFVPKN